MTEADVEPASDGIGKMSGSTEDNNGPDPVRDKENERGSGETTDVNPEPEESVKANGAEGKHEKPNEDIKPASERSLKTNGSATAEYSGPEDVLEEKSEEGNGRNVGEESTEMKREKEVVGLQELEFDNRKLQELPDTKHQGENVAQSDDVKIKAINAMKIPNETERSEAKDGDVPEHVKMLDAEDMKKVEDTEDDMTKTENEKVTEASDVVKPEDDSAAKTEDVKTSHAEDSEVSEASPKISDVDKPEDAVDDMAKTEDVEMPAGYMTKPEDAEISEAGDTKKLEGEESDMGIAEDAKTAEASYGDLNKAENSKISDDEITKRLESKDVNVPHAKDIVMLDADHVEDVKMVESDDSKLADSGDVRLVEVNDTKTPQVEETKDKDVTMPKCEDVQMPEANHMQDLLQSAPPQSDDTKTLETRHVKLVKLDEVNLPKVEKTKDEEEVSGGSRERKTEVLDNESAWKNEGISKSQDDKVSESEHLKAEKSPETVDKETTEVMEEDVNTPATEGTTEKGKVKEGGDEEKGMKGKDEETSVEARVSKKRRSRGQGSEKKDEAKEKKDTGRKEKEVIGSPCPSSSERPVRERKAVERLVEVLEKEQEQAKRFRIDKGRGTQLKDIPNVARKIARKKHADLKFLHQTLFGRVGKAGDYKNHILQFSGFTWHETEEKQRTKIKEKLDKCVKDALLDLCNLFNISVSRASVRKEELVAMLLDFMAAPHPISHDHDPDEKDQQSAKSRKRKRVDNSAKQSKKYTKTEGTRKTEYDSDFDSDEDEEEGNKEKGLSSEDEEHEHSENDTEKFASRAEAESDEDFSRKSYEKSKVSSKSKRVDKAEKSMASSPKKAVARSTTKSRSNRSASHKNSESNEDNRGGRKVFSRVKKNTDSPKKKSTTSKLDHKEKASGKRVATSRRGSKNTKESRPSDEDLRKTMREILSEVDFNTATFTDIFKQLGSHYKADLTERKASIKLILQEELTKLAEEAEDSEDDDDGGSGKDEGRSTRKKRVRV